MDSRRPRSQFVALRPDQRERPGGYVDFVVLGSVLIALALTALVLANTRRARRAWRTSLGALPEDDSDGRMP